MEQVHQQTHYATVVSGATENHLNGNISPREKQIGISTFDIPKEGDFKFEFSGFSKIVVFGRLHKMTSKRLNKNQNKSRAKRGLFWLNSATTMAHEQGN
jgi:hypothetical protein